MRLDRDRHSQDGSAAGSNSGASGRVVTEEHVRLHSHSQSAIQVVLMSLLHDIAVGRSASVRVTAAEGAEDEAGCWHVLVNMTITQPQQEKEG